ncbi:MULTISPECIES: hypothetical protein [unclassified Cedecea]|uniref:hypothetical protein n=1 Tax=unclassified Cedecea TaxID=2649846 RepID=UPI00301ADE0B
MEYLFLYFCFGVPVGLLEFVSVLFIRDSGAWWLKGVYALLVAIAWPLIIVLMFVPNSVLCKWRERLTGRLYE